MRTFTSLLTKSNQNGAPRRDGKCLENPTKQIDCPSAEGGPRKLVPHFRQIAGQLKSLVADRQRSKVGFKIPASLPIIEISAVRTIGAFILLRQGNQLSAGGGRCPECTTNTQKVDLTQDSEAEPQEEQADLRVAFVETVDAIHGVVVPLLDGVIASRNIMLETQGQRFKAVFERRIRQCRNEARQIGRVKVIRGQENGLKHLVKLIGRNVAGARDERRTGPPKRSSGWSKGNTLD